MANSLLDFVMSVVRDPDVAAQYAANPAQAIADAHLTDVTSADVNSLIPVVSESLSAAPATGLDVFGDAGNVWSSGAATAAFDAFDDHLPLQGVHDSVITDPDAHPDLASTVVDTGFDGGLADQGDLRALVTADDPALQLDAPVFDAVPADGSTVDALDDWSGLHDAPAHDPHVDTPGFDVFD